MPLLDKVMVMLGGQCHDLAFLALLEIDEESRPDGGQEPNLPFAIGPFHMDVYGFIAFIAEKEETVAVDQKYGGHGARS
jgi:hypothetical protein